MIMKMQWCEVVVHGVNMTVAETSQLVQILKTISNF